MSSKAILRASSNTRKPRKEEITFPCIVLKYLHLVANIPSVDRLELEWDGMRWDWERG